MPDRTLIPRLVATSGIAFAFGCDGDGPRPDADIDAAALAPTDSTPGERGLSDDAGPRDGTLDAESEPDVRPPLPDAALVSPDCGAPDFVLTTDLSWPLDSPPLADDAPLHRYRRYAVLARDTRQECLPLQAMYVGQGDTGHPVAFFEWWQADCEYYGPPDDSSTAWAEFCTIDDDGMTITMYWYGQTSNSVVSRHFVVLPADAPE